MEEPQSGSMSQPAVAASVAAPASAGNAALPPSFLQDPAGFLATIASQPASRQALSQISGPVAAWIPLQILSIAEQVAPVYLQAAAVQLKDTTLVGDMEQELVRTRQQYEILQAVGVAASQCQSRRMSITQSGILPTLADLVLNPTPPSTPLVLSQAAVEFLQCSLLAEQYRYAARIIQGTWPRPDSTVNIQQVLRYFYLRGMIHLGCNDRVLAHRCFWTCLSIPSEVCSRIMLEAWKKLVLVQCLEYKVTANDGSNGSGSSTTVLPKNFPKCMGQFLASVRDANAAPEFSLAKRPKYRSRQTVKQAPDDKTASQIACYMDLADAFHQRDKLGFESLLAQYQTTLTVDGNFGLANQCYSQLIHNQIRHMSKLYSVVPVTKISESLQMDPAQVTQLLCQSNIPCEIQEDGMVVFADEEERESGAEQTSLVDIQEWIQLSERVQKLDVAIGSTQKYHALARKEGSESKQAAAGPRGVDDF